MRLGKGKQTVLLAVFLLFSTLATGQAGKSHKYHMDGNLQIFNAKTESNSLVINYSITDLNIENIINEHGIFYRISISGHTPTTIPGKPELPVLSRLIEIPEGSDYIIRISEVSSTKLKPSGKKIEGILYPYQEGETKIIQSGKREFLIDKETYSSRDTCISPR